MLKDVVNGELNEGWIHVVDCDADPEFFSKWKKEEHRRMGKVELRNCGGRLYVNEKEVIRFLSENQKNNKVIKGHELRKELADKLILNFCILYYLLDHPELIPEDWKKNTCTYFWGTIFRKPGSSLCVAFLFWDEIGGKWCLVFEWLFEDWNEKGFAACLAA